MTYVAGARAADGAPLAGAGSRWAHEPAGQHIGALSLGDAESGPAPAQSPVQASGVHRSVLPICSPPQRVIRLLSATFLLDLNKPSVLEST